MNKLKNASKIREVCRCVINRRGELLFDRIDMGLGFLEAAENCSQRFELNIIGVKICDSTPDKLVGKDIKKTLVIYPLKKKFTGA